MFLKRFLEVDADGVVIWKQPIYIYIYIYLFIYFVEHLSVRGGQVVAVLRVVNSFPCVHQYVIITRLCTNTTPKIIINITSHRFINQCNTTQAD